MLEIDISELVMTEDYEYLYRGQPFTGLAIKTYAGKRLSETRFENGLKQGLARRWYPETELIYYEYSYDHNSLHGINRVWYENGQLKSESEEAHGITLRRTTWDQTGDVVESFELDPSDPLYRRAKA